MLRFVGSLVQKSIKRATAFLEAGRLICVVCTKKFQIGKSSFLASILESPERVAFPLSVHLYKNLSIEQRLLFRLAGERRHSSVSVRRLLNARLDFIFSAIAVTASHIADHPRASPRPKRLPQVLPYVCGRQLQKAV
jgi:hypothetical protein